MHIKQQFGFGSAFRSRPSPDRRLASGMGMGQMLRQLALLTILMLVLAGCGRLGLGTSSGSPQTIEQEMEAFLQAHMASGAFMGSVLAARGDEVLFSGGYGMANLEHSSPNTPETVFRIASLTKPFTAAAILQLQEQGRLDLNDSISRYLPDYPHGEEITIYQLLNHTSGIADYEFLYPTMVYRNTVNLEELMGMFSDMPLDFPPGSQFTYSNSGYVVLTAIIEKVSGQAYGDYLAEHIFQPLGMNATRMDSAEAILPGRAAGYTWDGAAYHNAEYFDISNVVGAGGLVSTVQDMYKWDRALYSDVVLGEDSLQAFFTPTSQFAEGVGYTYGGASMEVSGRNSILFSGEISGFFTTALRNPDEEIYVVVLSNISSPATQAVAQGLAAIALGDPYEVPSRRTAIELDPAISEKYAGEYQVNPDLIVTVISEAGQLFVEVPNQERFEIHAESETAFFAEVSGTELQLIFQVDADGAATGVLVIQDGQEILAEKID